MTTANFSAHVISRNWLKFFVLPILIGFCFAAINTEYVYAYTISFSGSSSIELDIKGGGDVNTSIVSDDIEITSNCRAGYNLLLTSSVNDNNLYLNGNNANNTSGTYFSPSDGTTALSSASNTWGYNLPASGTPTASTVFSPVPVSGGSAAILKTPVQTASATDIDDEFSVYYGVAASGIIAPGTYKMKQDSQNNYGTLVYFLTMDPSCASYMIEYDANGGTGTMTDQDIEVGSATKLTANAFTPPAYGSSYTDSNNTLHFGEASKLWTFWGWNTEIDGSGDWYKDKESVTDIANDGETITLYAQWKQPTLADLTTGTQTGSEKVIDHNTMQDMSPAACYNSTSFSAIGTAYGHTTLTDNRDGVTRTYTVAKQKDNLCWMTQSLNLGTSTAVTLTPDDTDITANFTLPASSSGNFTTSNTTANINKATVLNGMTISDYTVNNTAYSGRTMGYYSYAAATANTSTYSTTTSNYIFENSICAKNWDLPTNTNYHNLRTAGSIATYNNTNASYAGKNAGNEPYYFNYGGYRKATGTTYDTATFNNWNTYGYYWTANQSGRSQGYGTYVYDSGLYNSSNGTTYYKYSGLAVRCVADMGKVSITYHSNNSSASTQSETISINSGKIAASTLFTAESHKQFKGWNTSANGNGTSYTAGANLSSLGLYDGQNIELYAIWDDVWTLNFVNTIDVSRPRTKNVVQGLSTTVAPTSAFSRTGYKLKGWDTNSAGTTVVYTNNQNITPSSDMTFYTVWTPSYKIVYNGNGADSGNGVPTMTTTISGVGEGETQMLYASNFKRDGYGFAGWSFTLLNPASATFATDLANATIYGPMETITTPTFTGTPSSSASMNLYAVWVPQADDMQNWTGCDDMNIGDVTALMDIRDSQTYAVAKLADGNCWMIENLRLNNTNSDNTAGALAQGYGGVFAGLANPETANFGSTATANSLYYSGTQSGTATINIGTANGPANRMPRYNNANLSASSVSTSRTTTIYSYGNYYSWAAAMATTQPYSSYSTSATSDAGSDAAGTSICPSGWELPYAGTNNNSKSGSFYNLNRAITNQGQFTGTNALRSFPNNFIYSGAITTSSVGGRGTTGYYWSRSVINSSNAMRLNFSDSYGIFLSNNTSFYVGCAIRCLMKSS